MQKGKLTTINAESGFSLIELAMLLVILGLLLTPFLHFLSLDRHQRIVATTEGNLRIIDSALSKYAVRTGYYPRPAVRNLSRSAVGFGQDVALASVVACTGGGEPLVCRTNGARDTSADADSIVDPVLIGDIPFAEIGVPQKFILDGYSNRITYAVSERMTDTALSPVQDDWGAIEVLDGSGGNHQDTNRNAHYVLVSHGNNGEGTYSSEGGLTNACNA
ncbi:MAG: hypothetical protein JKY11_08625, partial [Alphaproteobacteria bacterium]|nr:hypothetical protein [Alphaproteobacteria bacterium]